MEKQRQEGDRRGLAILVVAIVLLLLLAITHKATGAGLEAENGDDWLSWTQNEREFYARGYICGLYVMAGISINDGGGDRDVIWPCMILDLDVKVVAGRTTAYYKKGGRDEPILAVMGKVSTGENSRARWKGPESLARGYATDL